MKTTVVRISNEQMLNLRLLAQELGLSRLQTINLLVEKEYRKYLEEKTNYDILA